MGFVQVENHIVVHEERELSHSHPQFPRTTLGTPGTMTPIWRPNTTTTTTTTNGLHFLTQASYGSPSNNSGFLIARLFPSFVTFHKMPF